MERIRNFAKQLVKTRFRRWLLIYLPLALLVFIVTCDQMVEQNAKGRMYTNVSDVPAVSAVLVLGTSPGTKGKENLFYKYRMEAAAALWIAGKAKYIIVSGDNSTVYYDEATYMRNTLLALGIPDSVIKLDYAGFRTLDSVVRAYWVFGQKNIIVVSQEFHNERALYLADHFGINAIGFCAQDVPEGRGMKTYLREYLARVAAVLDVHVWKTTPKFPGPPEPLAK
jgi:SanA protein